jgi:Trk K+ transport system NAD-binding subunit
MLTVYKVSDTRLVLPDSQWGKDVIKALTTMGHHVEITDQDPDSCKRDEAEMARMHQLLDSTGI